MAIAVKAPVRSRGRLYHIKLYYLKLHYITFYDGALYVLQAGARESEGPPEDV